MVPDVEAVPVPAGGLQADAGSPLGDARPVRSGAEARGPSVPAGTAQAASPDGVEIGQQVRIAGKRGSYRVVGFRSGGVQLMDDDQKWHVVRPEAVRPLQSSPPSRAGRTRSAAG